MSHSLTNFEIQRYYQNEPKFNGAYSRNNVPKVKDEKYIINLDGFKSTGTHWIALWIATMQLTLIALGLNIPRETKKFLGNKSIITNIYRIQAYDSIMCWYFCIGLLILWQKVKVC